MPNGPNDCQMVKPEKQIRKKMNFRIILFEYKRLETMYLCGVKNLQGLKNTKTYSMIHDRNRAW